MRPSRVVALLAALLVGAPSARAQAPTAPSAAAPAPEAAVSASHRAAVQRLMAVTRVREMTEGNSEAMLAAQLRQMPQLGPFAGILRDFYREQMNWAVLEPEFTRLYVEVFSEAELRDLTRFYESPLGRTLLDKMPLLMAKSQELTARRMQAAMPQLTQRIMAAMQEQAGTRPDSARTGKP
jgi:uncharacterized protein